jgi:hypothetical protein
VLLLIQDRPLQHVPLVEELPEGVLPVDHRLGAVRDGHDRRDVPVRAVAPAVVLLPFRGARALLGRPVGRTNSGSSWKTITNSRCGSASKVRIGAGLGPGVGVEGRLRRADGLRLERAWREDVHLQPVQFPERPALVLGAAARDRVAPDRARRLHDQGPEEAVDVRAVLAAGVVPPVVDGEDALMQALPAVRASAPRRGEARVVPPDLGPVIGPHVVAVPDEMQPDVASADLVLELHAEVVALPGPEHERADQGMRQARVLRRRGQLDLEEGRACARAAYHVRANRRSRPAGPRRRADLRERADVFQDRTFSVSAKIRPSWS